MLLSAPGPRPACPSYHIPMLGHCMGEPISRGHSQGSELGSLTRVLHLPHCNLNAVQEFIQVKALLLCLKSLFKKFSF